MKVRIPQPPLHHDGRTDLCRGVLSDGFRVRGSKMVETDSGENGGGLGIRLVGDCWLM